MGHELPLSISVYHLKRFFFSRIVTKILQSLTFDIVKKKKILMDTSKRVVRTGKQKKMCYATISRDMTLLNLF